MKGKLYSTDDSSEDAVDSGSDKRRKGLKHEVALLELAGQITRLEELDFDRLGLPEEVGDAVAAARACRPGKPLNRALRRVRAALRELEPEQIANTRTRLD